MMKATNKVVKRLTVSVVALWVVAAALPALADTVEYLHTDNLGTPIAVTDASGAVIQTSEYAPYGQLLNRSTTNGPGYTGHVEDAATGLIYMQQRYYDSSVGRFVSVDIIHAGFKTGGNFDRYWYGRNSPYKNTDPDGRWTIAIGAGGSASAIAGISGSAQYTFSFPSANPATWQVGILSQEGVQASTDIAAGGGVVISYSDADSVQELAGSGPENSAGGSANILGVSVGYEQTICIGCKVTHTISFGGKLNLLPVEFHTTVSVAQGVAILGNPAKTPTVTVGTPVMMGSSNGDSSRSTGIVTVGPPSKEPGR